MKHHSVRGFGMRVFSRTPWFDASDLTRSDVVTFMRLRSGHIPLNSFAYLFGKTNSPNCPSEQFGEFVLFGLLEDA